MSLSKRTKPCFHLSAGADVTQLMGLRHELKKKIGFKITTNAFYIRALALGCAEYPLIMGKFDGENVTIPPQINVGFAVSAPQGLVVPVITDADKKTLADIAKLEKLLTNKARSNCLALEDIENETIALSNLGVYGIDSFLAIVPPPASVILAVGTVKTTPVIISEKKITIRKMLNLSLTVDHGVINGDYAAGFLKHFTELLKNPRDIL